MTNKDEASPRQRIIMEQRWEKARQDCAEGVCCVDNAKWHVSGCPRRKQRIKVTNLNTGVESEATIMHSDARAVKNVLADHDKQAVRLEPVPATSLTQAELDEIFAAQQAGQVVIVPQEDENWSRWERGVFEERFEADQHKELHRPGIEKAREYYDKHDSITGKSLETPARPWWRFWGRRG